ALASRHARDARFGRELARPALVAQHADRGDRRADERDLARLADLGEMGVLREEAVAGVDRVRVRDFCRADDLRDVEVALLARSWPDADRLIGELEVARIAIRLRVDRDRLDVELPACAEDPER